MSRQSSLTEATWLKSRKLQRSHGANFMEPFAHQRNLGRRNVAQLVVFDLVRLINAGCVKLKEETVLQALCWVCDHSV